MSRPEVVAVIQARMGSTRLPGKVLLHAAGVPVLGHVIRRVRAAAGVSRVVVATSSLPADDPIVAVSRDFGAEVSRGSESDVLSRFALAFREHGGEIGVRVTSDCPLFDFQLLDTALCRFMGAGEPLDYLSNTVERSYPRGYDLEVFRVAALFDADRRARDASSREHVTPFLYRNPDRFRTGALRRPDPRCTADWRLTLDTADDWRVLSFVIGELAPTDPLFGLGAVETLLTRRADVLEWNRHVEQKAH